MRKSVTILFLGISLFGFSQKVKLKKGDILIDEKPWMKYDGCKTFDDPCSVLNLSGEELIFIKYVDILQEDRISEFDVNYSEVKFLGTNTFVEFEGKANKEILELIYKSKLIDESGQLNEENVQRFIEKYGRPISKRLNRPKNNTNTVIIKEEPSRGSGININIGRQ